MSLLILPDDLLPEYQLLDSGDGKRLEKFGPYTLSRLDPQALWIPGLPESEWRKASATFKEGGNSQERWFVNGKLPPKWKMEYKDLSFYLKLSPFKHTGVFPEQALNWIWMEKLIDSRLADARSNQKVNILNLFAYTGVASLVAAQHGAKVTHVDGSRPTIGWAKENQIASKLAPDSIRWILDDCLQFAKREVRRGVKYDGIILDPPVYGHGPKGEKWDFDKDFPKLMEVCRQLLSDNPLFIIVNAYAVSASYLMLENILEDTTRGLGGEIEAGELVLKERKRDRLLSTGIFARWSKPT
jgi:23S rRNA (cytosine1962-C5)-methyltransferase